MYCVACNGAGLDADVPLYSLNDRVESPARREVLNAACRCGRVESSQLRKPLKPVRCSAGVAGAGGTACGASPENRAPHRAVIATCGNAQVRLGMMRVHWVGLDRKSVDSWQQRPAGPVRRHGAAPCLAGRKWIGHCQPPGMSGAALRKKRVCRVGQGVWRSSDWLRNRPVEWQAVCADARPQ